MRSFWSGEIAFGLVTIPAKLYTATHDGTPHFHLLHKECGTPIVTVRRCPKHERDLSWDEIGKGYEVSKGRYVLFGAEELAKLEEDEEKGTIDLVQFIDPGEVDLAYVENSYWVAPGGKSPRAYELLRRGLEQRKSVALAKVKLRTRTRLALLRPRERLFALDILRFAEELVAGDELAPEKTKAPSAEETQLALHLIDQLSGTFDPAKHPDQYRSGVLAAADKKAAAGEVAERAGEDEDGAQGKAKAAKVIDLTALLSQSIAASKGRGGKAKTYGARRSIRQPLASTRR